MSVAAKIHEALKLLGVSQKDFALNLGISGNAITEIIKGRTRNITDSVKIAAEYVYGIDRNWWDDKSEGGRFLIPEQGKPASVALRGEGFKIDPDIARPLDNLVKAIEKKVSSKLESAHIAHGEVREVSQIGRIAAGLLTEAVLQKAKKHFVSKSLIPIKGQLFMLTVSGDSMKDLDIRDGDKVIFREVHDVKALKDGAIIAALVNGENTLKRLVHEGGKTILRAANPAFKDIVINDGDDAMVQGELVFQMRDWSKG